MAAPLNALISQSSLTTLSISNINKPQLVYSLKTLTHQSSYNNRVHRKGFRTSLCLSNRALRSHHLNYMNNREAAVRRVSSSVCFYKSSNGEESGLDWPVLKR